MRLRRAVALVGVLPLLAVGCSAPDDSAEVVDPGASASSEDLVADFSYEVSYDTEQAQPTYCPLAGVQLTDESEGGPTAWEWDLGGGDTSTEPDPFLEGEPEGPVTLTVTRARRVRQHHPGDLLQRLLSGPCGRSPPHRYPDAPSDIPPGPEAPCSTT